MGIQVSETSRGAAQLQRAYLHTHGADGRLELDKLLLSSLVCPWGGNVPVQTWSSQICYGALVPNSPQAGRNILSLERGVICDTELWGIRIAQVPWLPCKSWQGYVPSSWNLTELHHSECEQGEAWGSEQVLCLCFPAVSIDLTDIGLDSQALFHA